MGIDTREGKLGALVALLIVLIVIAGCASTEGGYTRSADVESKLRSMTPAEVLADLGDPKERVALAQGSEQWK